MSEQDDSSNLQEMIETSRSQNELEESYRKNYLANREILASILVSLCSIFPAGAAGFLFVSAISRNSFLDESIFYWAGFNGFLAAISATACWHLLKKIGLPLPVASILTIFLSPWAPLYCSGTFSSIGGDLSYAVGYLSISFSLIAAPSFVSSALVVLIKSGVAKNALAIESRLS